MNNEQPKQQTAVEWLFQQLWDEPKDKFTWYAIREKAIQMEWEQIVNAHINGYDSSGGSANEYYNELYNQ